MQGNSLMRILCVAAFAVSGYASTDGRICKPFNPLLGETYEANYPDKGLRFFSEKVFLLTLLSFPSPYILYLSKGVVLFFFVEKCTIVWFCFFFFFEKKIP